MNAYICGCVRNNAQHLFDVFTNIAQLSPLVFREIHIVIAYDDSDDGSLELLLKLKTQFSKMDILRGNPESRTNVRVENIARARNAILAHLRQIHFVQPNESEWPYFIMMDMDDVCSGKIYTQHLMVALEPSVAATWDALSFNSDNYNDIWALSFGQYKHSCWHWDDPLPIIYETQDCLKRILTSANPELFSCLSAFNGFAIYRMVVFLDSHYLPKLSPYLDFFSLPDRSPRRFHTETDYVLALDNPDKHILGDCEHRHFHLEAVVQKGARIKISPQRLFDSVINANIK